MDYTVKIENLPEKEFLVIKGFVELGGNTPDAYAEQARIFSQRVKDGSIERLLKTAGSDIIYTLFCHTCQLDEQTGGYICGNDIACENINHVSAGGEFDIVCLKPSEYAVFECSFTNGITMEQMNKRIDDIYWHEWLPGTPYESMIEVETGANTQGIACIVMTEPWDLKAETAGMTIWFPIQYKQHTLQGNGG